VPIFSVITEIFCTDESSIKVDCIFFSVAMTTPFVPTNISTDPHNMHASMHEGRVIGTETDRCMDADLVLSSHL
jgi:hypothetical protein